MRRWAECGGGRKGLMLPQVSPPRCEPFLPGCVLQWFRVWRQDGGGAEDGDVSFEKGDNSLLSEVHAN